jgi:GWxTD domain-containing protein
VKTALAAAGLLALLAGVTLAGPAPLPWRSTGKMGFAVDAAAFPESAGAMVEVYVRVPPATIAALHPDLEGGRRLSLGARLRGAFGGNPQVTNQQIEITPADSGAGFGKVVLFRFRTRTGGHRLLVRVEDPNSKKRGIAYMGRKVTEGSEVEGDFEVPAPRSGRSLSHLEFAWLEDSTSAPGAFARAGRRVIPNPERLFGLFATDLKAFYVVRGRPGDDRPWQARSRIIDHDGRIVAQRETTYAAASRFEGSITEDLTHEPAGGYALDLRVWQPGDTDTLAQSARWSLAWQPSSWFRSAREVEESVHFLLDTDTEESFALMNQGEQESFLEAFWLKRDPTPGTGRNEAREEFLRRIVLANRAYGRTGPMAGMFSDMGRVFIRYGEPSEVMKQVIPSGDNTLLQAIKELSLSEDRDIGDVHQKGLGGDIRPYEVWIYEGEIPLPYDADPSVERSNRRRRLVFLFVDDNGTGDFRLRFSTE